jgi:hypothetical protein
MPAAELNRFGFALSVPDIAYSGNQETISPAQLPGLYRKP